MGSIKFEVNNLIDSRFILVIKKNVKIRICIDFWDLNKACPKNNFSLPIANVMINSMRGYEHMFFMDEFFGYSLIKTYHDKEKHTSFRTLLEVYSYTVIPFTKERRCHLPASYE